MVAYVLDEALALVDDIADRWAREKSEADVTPSDDQRFATDADYADDESEAA